MSGLVVVTIVEAIVPWLIKCTKEYTEFCDGCEFNNYELVSHPGGTSTEQVEKHYCEEDYWEDDF